MSEDEQKIKTWLTEVFQAYNFDDFTFMLANYDKNGGYAAEMNYADVLATKNGEQQTIHVIIKKNKEGNEVMDTLGMREFYSNEVRFYSKIIPIFKRFANEHQTGHFVDIPHCYGTVERGDHYVIILENLKPKNFRTHQADKTLDVDHVKLVLKAYGTWHAFSLAFKDQKPQDFEAIAATIKPNKCLDILKNTIEHEIDETIRLFTSKNKDHIKDKLKVLKEDFGKKYDDLMQNKDEHYSVLRHGDSWNNNFLFHYNEGQAKPDKTVIIDWQISYLGSPLFDVTNFIFNCCSKKELLHMDELMEVYYDALSKKVTELGGDPQKLLPWDICQESFLKYAPVSISMMILLMRMRYKIDAGTQNDIADCLKDGTFSALHGDGIRNPEKHFEELDELLEYVIERKWI